MLRLAAAPTMPHMGLALLPGWFPGRNRYLLGARHSQLPGRRVLADRRAGADIGTARDAQRRDQRRVRADEALIFDHGAVLVGPAVVAGDGPGADVDPRADLGIADVGEMVRLRARADPARLPFDAIDDLHVLGEARARAQPRVRTDPAVRADL